MPKSRPKDPWIRQAWVLNSLVRQACLARNCIVPWQGQLCSCLEKNLENPRGSKELLSVVGKAMHSVQFCRPLACLFDCLYSTARSACLRANVPSQSRRRTSCS